MKCSCFLGRKCSWISKVGPCKGLAEKRVKSPYMFIWAECGESCSLGCFQIHTIVISFRWERAWILGRGLWFKIKNWISYTGRVQSKEICNWCRWLNIHLEKQLEQITGPDDLINLNNNLASWSRRCVPVGRLLCNFNIMISAYFLVLEVGIKSKLFPFERADDT
jgi:hypothetical protein